MVEQLPHHLKVEDSSPGSAGRTGKDTMAKNELNSSLRMVIAGIRVNNVFFSSFSLSRCQNRDLNPSS